MFYIAQHSRPFQCTATLDGRKEFVETYAVYSFSTLKLQCVFLEKVDAEAYMLRHGITKCILVRYLYRNNDMNVPFVHGSKRLAYTPEKLDERLQFSDIRKGKVNWNRVEGSIMSPIR